MSWWLPQASEHAGQIDQLLVFSLLIVAGLLALWGGAFALCLWRASRRIAAPRAIRGRLPLVAEIALVTAEVALLVGLALPIARLELVDAAPAGGDVQVRVVAQQFAWNVHYPGPDGVFGRSSPERVDELSNPLGLDPDDPFAADDVTALNRLRLPAGRRVLLHLTSRDVIHGFALPHFRVQRDAIPGLVAKVAFVPRVSTEAIRRRLGDPSFDFEIVCAQLCGLGHSRMRGVVEVMEPTEFEAWLARQAAVELDDFWS